MKVNNIWNLWPLKYRFLHLFPLFLFIALRSLSRPLVKIACSIPLYLILWTHLYFFTVNHAASIFIFLDPFGWLMLFTPVLVLFHCWQHLFAVSYVSWFPSGRCPVLWLFLPLNLIIHINIAWLNVFWVLLVFWFVIQFSGSIPFSLMSRVSIVGLNSPCVCLWQAVGVKKFVSSVALWFNKLIKIYVKKVIFL